MAPNAISDRDRIDDPVGWSGPPIPHLSGRAGGSDPLSGAGMLFVSSLAHRLFPDRYRCLSRAHHRFVGWAGRSDAHHPDRSDPENIQRHRRFMGGVALSPPYALVIVGVPVSTWMGAASAHRLPDEASSPTASEELSCRLSLASANRAELAESRISWNVVRAHERTKGQRAHTVSFLQSRPDGIHLKKTS